MFWIEYTDSENSTRSHKKLRCLTWEDSWPGFPPWESGAIFALNDMSSDGDASLEISLDLNFWFDSLQQSSGLKLSFRKAEHVVRRWYDIWWWCIFRDVSCSQHLCNIWCTWCHQSLDIDFFMTSSSRQFTLPRWTSHLLVAILRYLLPPSSDTCCVNSLSASIFLLSKQNKCWQRSTGIPTVFCLWMKRRTLLSTSRILRRCALGDPLSKVCIRWCFVWWGPEMHARHWREIW